jgi:RNA polymerase sigma factor (sigma-70 family)
MDKYNDVVSDWFERLQTPFINFIRGQFPKLSYDDVNDIYQNTFIAVYNNIQKGNVKADTKWKSYIFEIGRRMAMKMMGMNPKFVDMIYDSEPGNVKEPFDGIADDDLPWYKQEKAIEVLDEQLKYIPEPCHTILIMFYYEKRSMDEIALNVNYKNSQTAKAKKNQCMDKLKTRVKMAFKFAGIKE